MQDRDISITSLRPVLDHIKLGIESSPIEYFQNASLRPILKLQNDVLVSTITQYIANKRVDLTNWTQFDKEKYINNLMRKDGIIRNIMIGSVIGMMTLEELKTYFQFESECRNRIVKMILKRVLEQI